jgi:hypothetical protein
MGWGEDLGSMLLRGFGGSDFVSSKKFKENLGIKKNLE